MEEFVSIYTTTSSQEEAEKIANILLSEGMIACANIFPSVRSIYKWQGKLERADECAMIMKTSSGKNESVCKKIKEIHSYDCPCIVVWPIVGIEDQYAEWIRSSLL